MPDESAPEPGPSPEPRDSTRREPGVPWRLFFSLLLAVVIVIFAVQNTQEVDLRFLVWEWRLPLVVVLLIAVVASVLLDQVVGGVLRRRRRRRVD